MAPDTPALPPSTGGTGVLIVLNSLSGAAVVRADPRPVFAARLPAATVHELAEDEDLTEVVARRMADDGAPTVLGVYGGDGSVSRMAGLARRYGVPLLAMPGGTFNHFARSIGVDDVDAAIDALEAGESRAVTVIEASVDDEEPMTVLNAVSVGTYPSFLDEREQRAQLGKWVGGVVAASSEFRAATPIDISREGRRAAVWSVFIGVGRNDPGRIATMQRETANDGVLDVRIHHARGTRLRATMASLAFGRRTAGLLRTVRLMPPDSDVERLVLTEITVAVRPRPGRPSVWVHDGELEERDPAGFSLHCVAVASAVQVYAPSSR